MILPARVPYFLGDPHLLAKPSMVDVKNICIAYRYNYDTPRLSNLNLRIDIHASKGMLFFSIPFQLLHSVEVERRYHPCLL